MSDIYYVYRNGGRLNRQDRREIRRVQRHTLATAAGIKAETALHKLRIQGAEQLSCRAIEALADIDATRRMETALAGNELFAQLAAGIEIKAARQLSDIVDDYYDTLTF